MTEQRYRKVEQFFRSSPKLLRCLRGLDQWLPALFYIAYPGLVIALFFLNDPRAWKSLVIPAVLFLAVTVLRHLINAKRPYETLPIRPLIEKDQKGKSFPSRHVTSAFAVAEAFAYVSPLSGAVFAVLGIAIAVIRVVGGLHYIRDVVSGALFSMVLGIPAFLFLPF